MIEQTYREIEGDLIKLAKEGKFDVIAHGCNCFCTMKRGIAPQMAAAFGCDRFSLEDDRYEGDITKLGNIDWKNTPITKPPMRQVNYYVKVVNAYTQYHWNTQTKPFDYEAFTLCMRKMNKVFAGERVGLPQIGSHLAGGDWERIKTIIRKELTACNVTVVIYKP